MVVRRSADDSGRMRRPMVDMGCRLGMCACVKVRMTLCGVDFRVAEDLALEPAMGLADIPEASRWPSHEPQSSTTEQPNQYRLDIPGL